MKIVKHIEYDEEYELDELEGMPLEPKCGECGFNALRQKCAFELGGMCGRHAIAGVYVDEKLKWAQNNTPEGCTCHDRWKATDKWPKEHQPPLTVRMTPCPLRSALHGD